MRLQIIFWHIDGRPPPGNRACFGTDVYDDVCSPMKAENTQLYNKQNGQKTRYVRTVGLFIFCFFLLFRRLISVVTIGRSSPNFATCSTVLHVYEIRPEVSDHNRDVQGRP